MNHRHKLLAKFAALLAVSLLVFAACGGDDGSDADTDTAVEETEATETEATETDITISYASPVATQPNQIYIQNGMERTAESLGWDYEVLDSDLSPDRQVSNIDTMITTGADGIASWTLDPGALDAAYERAADEGIPLVGLNSEGEYINTDIKWEVYECEDDGSKQQTVDFILENKGEGAQVLVVGPPPVPVLVEGMQCFIDRAEQSGLEIAGRQDNVDDQAATATPLVEDMLSQQGEVDAIWSYNDTSAIGAGAAVDNQGFDVFTADSPEGIITIGSNGDAEAIDAIRAGRLTMTWDALAAETGAAVIRALAPVLSDGEDISAMPNEIMLDSIMITADNVDDFVPPDDRELDIDDLPIIDEN